MPEKIHALIMAGGRGSRFWPLGREKCPKQFLSLDGGDCLLMRAYRRAAALTDGEAPYLAIGADQCELLHAIEGGDWQPQRVICEPLAKNTAAAVYWSSQVMRAQGCGGVTAVFPADHQIENEKGFEETLRLAAEVAEKEKCIVVIGIRPLYPACGFGYIERGRRETTDSGGAYCRVRRFVEKPHREKARRYLKKGTYYWNSGIIVFPLAEIEAVYEQLLPDYPAAFAAAVAAIGTETEAAELTRAFEAIEAVSFDVAILEKAKNTCMVEAAFGWDDVGSFNSLGSLIEPDEERNICRGNLILKDVKNSIIIGDNPLIAVIGLRDVVVVESEGVLLVCPRKRVEEVRDVVGQLTEEDARFR